MNRPRILLLEDEPDIREIVEYTLRRDGYQVQTSADGAAGLAAARQSPPDMVILDLMLPGMDGLEVCRRLRAEPSTAGVAIIMVTAKGEESDVVLGLGLGADDYLPKPFRPNELLARVQAVLRRTRDRAAPADARRRVVLGPLLIDPERHKVLLDGSEVQLTATEFRILHHLAGRPGRVFTRDQLLEASVGPNVVVLERNVDVHIRSIRKKLGTHRGLIETVRSVGYRFAES
jgi:DNA-binding response OmpR family regulator